MDRGGRLLRGTAMIAAMGAVALAAAPAAALDPGKKITQYARQTWDTSHGLPQNSVLSISRTKDGYLWLGTEEGLVRFDGVRFTVLDRSNHEGMSHNNVQGLSVDAQGVLWMAMAGGGMIRYQDGRFRSFTRDDGMPVNTARGVLAARDGSVWVATEGGGAVRYSAGRFKAFGVAEGLASDLTRAVVEDHAGNIWVGTAAGVARIAGGVVTRFGRAEGIPHPVVRSLFVDSSDALWIGTEGGGLARMKEGRVTVYSKRDGLARDIVRVIYEDRAGGLWVGTEGGGLCRLRGQRFECLGTKDGLPDDNIRAILEDGEGSLWVGTYAGGLVQLRDGKVTPWGVPEGLPHDIVRSVYAGEDGAIWLGTYGAGVSRFKDGVFTNWKFGEGAANNLVYAVARDGTGALWVGTGGSGVLRVKDGVHQVYGPEEAGAPIVRVVYADTDGSIWVGSEGGGLRHFENGRFRAYTTADGLPTNVVRVILRSRTGDLLVGTSAGGLARLRDGRFSVVSTRDGLSSDLVFSLLEDEDGTLWVGTYGGGLNRIRDGRITSYTARNGLFNDVVYSIVDDRAGHLWMTCNKGIFRVARKELDDFAAGRVPVITSTSFGLSDGMRSNECNGGSQGAGLRASDGKLWFPTIRGVAVIDPVRLPRNTQPPPVRIEKVVAGERTIPLVGGVRLEPEARTLEFQYTALAFLAPSRVTFRYRLDPLDRSWIQAGDRRVAYYTNLPAGSYVFHVTATNEDGVPAAAEASFAFAIRPRFFQTVWFRLFAAITVIGLVGLGYGARIRALKARERELVHTVDQRTAELAQLNQELARANADLGAANERLERLSTEDPLTGLPNRRSFDRTFDLEIRRAHRSGASVALLMIDVDDFKPFNDLYGHMAGDECLRTVAAALRATLRRAGDFVARYGGEEFVAILPDASAEGALVVARRMRLVVSELAIPHRGSSAARHVTISVGVALAGGREAGPQLASAADMALYEAKRRGRDRVVLYGEGSGSLPA